jgi:hypothetical protein
MKAKRTPRNAVEFALYGFMEAVGAAMKYQDIFECALGDGVILEPGRMFVSADGKHWHSRECADEWAWMESQHD